MGRTLSAMGLGAVIGGLIVCCLGEKQGLNLAVGGMIGTTAASISFAAASFQRDEEDAQYLAEGRYGWTANISNR